MALSSPPYPISRKSLILGRVLAVEHEQRTLYARIQEVAAYEGTTEYMTEKANLAPGTLIISEKYGRKLLDIATWELCKPSCVTLIAGTIRDGRGLREFAQGPGNLTYSLGIDDSVDSLPLAKSSVWI